MSTTTVAATANIGINRDVNPRHQPPGTYRDALNKVPSTERYATGGLTNELRRVVVGSIPGIVGYHPLEEINSILVFHKDGGNTLSLFNTDTFEVTKVISDTEVKCDWKFDKCKWIGYSRATSKALGPCNDIVVYWASGKDYWVANISELLDEKRKAAVLEKPDPCDYFKLFKNSPFARLKMRAMRGGGRDLVSGQYFCVARYKDQANNYSNWTVIEGPVYIESKYNRNYDGREYSRQSIRIEARDLSKNYTGIEIAVIPPVGSQEQDVAHVIYDGSYNTSGVSCVYSSTNQHKFSVPISEVLKKDIKFLRGENLFQQDNELNLYRTFQEFNYNGQKRALDVRVSFLAYLVPMDKAHLYKSIPRDEPIALSHNIQYIDGTSSAWFHIPGAAGGSNTINCTDCTLPGGHTHNNSQIIREYTTLTGNAPTYCFTSGQETTPREGYSPATACAELPIEPRTDTSVPCVDHTADKDGVQDKIDATVVRPKDLEDCLDCNQEKTLNDLEVSEGFFVQRIEHTTDLFRLDSEVAADCTIGDHTNIRTAAKTLYDEAIKTAELDEEVTYRSVTEKKDSTDIKVTQAAADGSGNANGPEVVRTKITGEDVCTTEDIQPILWREYSVASWESSLRYPKSKDCDGNYFFGDLADQRIRHPKTPGTDICPLFVSFASGVESRFDPANTPGKDTYAVILGLKVENVYLPSYEKGEIPKPLNTNEPYRIGIVKPELHNQTNVYHGIVTPTFSGKIGGRTYAVPSLAASSYVTCDGHIDNDGSRLGEKWDTPIYNLHTPDDGAGTDFITCDYIKVEGVLYGQGRVYGLYSKGKNVKEDENRQDRRGARGALNFTRFTPNTFYTCLKGAEYLEPDTSLTNPQGIDYPILNKQRESSIVFQTEQPLPVIGRDNQDHSFNGGGLDHEYPTEGYAWYVTMKRINTQQYGNIESLQYIDLGLTPVGMSTSVQGPCGTVFVQQYSHKRTALVSDKVGNYLNVDYPITATDEFLGPPAPDGRDRSVCDPPNRRGYRMKEFLGFWNPLQLPDNGDKKDPKNMANMHPTKGFGDIFNTLWEPETDVYYPRTLNYLLHFPVESYVNLHYRSTNRPETRDIFYENLQGVDLDNSIYNVDPENAWLNDYYELHEQPSVKQQNRRIWIRTALVILLPALFGAGVAGIETSLEGGATMFTAPGFYLLWNLLVYNIFTNKKIDQMFGVPPCLIDEEGGIDNTHIRGFRDNWFDYNWGFSAMNDLNINIGQPANYITCICDKVTNIVYTSNTQIQTSPYDAWDNFQALSYTGISGESGEVQILWAWGNKVFAQTTDGLIPIQHKNITVPTSAGGQLLGNSKWIASPSKVLEGTAEGFMGTHDPNATAIFQRGVATIDREARSISIFDGRINPVNSKLSGLYHWMWDNLPFCSETGCSDNPTGGSHYTFGYDPETNRLLITKSGEFTWSFDLDSKMFISRHSYVPDFYFWNRNKMFSVEGDTIYLHNKEGGYMKPCSIDLVIRAENTLPFSFVDACLDTEVNKYSGSSVPSVLDVHETYDYLTVYSADQQTGRVPVRTEVVGDMASQVRREKEIVVSRRSTELWKMQTIRANELTGDEPIVIPGTCGKEDTVSETNIDFNKNWTKNNKMIGKYMVFKLEYTGDNQIVFNNLIASITPTK